MTYSYEERAKNMGHIVEQHKEQTTFEDFASQVFAPVLPPGKLTSKLTASMFSISVRYVHFMKHTWKFIVWYQ